MERSSPWATIRRSAAASRTGSVSDSGATASLAESARRREADFAYAIPGVGRFRVNAFRARGTAGLVFRRVALGAIPLEDLGLPQTVSSLALEPRGLVLVTGPTGGRPGPRRRGQPGRRAGDLHQPA